MRQNGQHREQSCASRPLRAWWPPHRARHAANFDRQRILRMPTQERDGIPRGSARAFVSCPSIKSVMPAAAPAVSGMVAFNRRPSRLTTPSTNRIATYSSLLFARRDVRPAQREDRRRGPMAMMPSVPGMARTSVRTKSPVRDVPDVRQSAAFVARRRYSLRGVPHHERGGRRPQFPGDGALIQVPSVARQHPPGSRSRPDAALGRGHLTSPYCALLPSEPPPGRNRAFAISSGLRLCRETVQAVGPEQPALILSRPPIAGSAGGAVGG